MIIPGVMTARLLQPKLHCILLCALVITTTTSTFQHAPAFFHRRGEPFNAHDFQNHPLYTTGCYSLNTDAAHSNQRWCFEKQRPNTNTTYSKNNVFDFLSSRQHFQTQIMANYNTAKKYFSHGINLDYNVTKIDHSLLHFGSANDCTSRGSTYLQTVSGLLHGAEQIFHLIEKGLLPDAFQSIAQSYTATIKAIKSSISDTSSMATSTFSFQGTIFFVPTMDHLKQQYFTFNTLLYYPPPFVLPTASFGTDGVAVSVLNTKGNIDWHDVEARFLKGEVVVVDDVLAPWALKAAYDFCLEATIYSEQKIGYLGAYDVDGLFSGPFPLITDAFRKAMPKVIGETRLDKFWSYKYVSEDKGGEPKKQQRGTNKHTDRARVNLNLWITPDESNLDPLTGGLTVWDYTVSKEEEFNRYQNPNGGQKLAEAMKLANAKPTSIPYRRNRMVIFDSDRVHETSDMHFKPGHKNRRINLTWLYGDPSWVKINRNK
jgi:hypothetical protein